MSLNCCSYRSLSYRNCILSLNHLIFLWVIEISINSFAIVHQIYDTTIGPSWATTAIAAWVSAVNRYANAWGTAIISWPSTYHLHGLMERSFNSYATIQQKFKKWIILTNKLTWAVCCCWCLGCCCCCCCCCSGCRCCCCCCCWWRQCCGYWANAVVPAWSTTRARLIWVCGWNNLKLTILFSLNLMHSPPRFESHAFKQI